MKNIKYQVRKANSFYYAARNQHIFPQLEQVGFNAQALAEGPAYLRKVVMLARRSGYARTLDGELLNRFEVYQRRWFATVRAVLKRNYPELIEPFFKNLVQREGKESPLAVSEFLRMLEQLGKGDAPFGEQGPKARVLLAERMLTAEVEAEGHDLVDRWAGPRLDQSRARASCASVAEVARGMDRARAYGDHRPHYSAGARCEPEKGKTER
jgi:hypothetical protein